MDERRPFLLIAWVLLLALFLWSIEPVLSPIVLALAIAYLLGPLFGTETYRRLIVVVGVLTLLWLLQVAGSVLAPFALALVLAYVAHPLVDWGERHGVSRGIGAMLAILLTGLVLAGGIVLLVPIVTEQGSQFLQDLPGIVEEAQGWYRTQVRALAESGLPLLRDVPFERALEVRSEDVMEFVGDHIQALAPSLQSAFGVGRGVVAALTVLGYLVLTPVLTFYLMRDYPKMGEWIHRVLPRDGRERTESFLGKYDELLGEYLRGQLVVAIFVGIATGLGFLLVGFPNAILLGVVAGVFNIVPYLGLVVSLIPALAIALVTPPLWLSLLKVAGVFFAVQAIDGYVLSPRIIGERVGLHPVWVMLAIIVAGSFFGIVGLLLAIPVAVLIKLLIMNTLITYKRSVYYSDAKNVADEG